MFKDLEFDNYSEKPKVANKSIIFGCLIFFIIIISSIFLLKFASNSFFSKEKKYSTNQFDLKDADKERIYNNSLHGFSMIIPKHWVYYESDYEKTIIYHEIDGKEKANIEIIHVDTMNYNQYLGKKIDYNLNLKEIDIFFSSLIKQSFDIAKKEKINVKGGSGYRYIYSNGNRSYILKMEVPYSKSKTKTSKLILIFNDSTYIYTDDEIEDLENVVKSIKVTFIDIEKVPEYSKKYHDVSFEYCNNMKNVINWDACYKALAIKLSEDKYCEFVQSKKERNECYEMYKGDESACNVFYKQKECYTELALMKRDISYCDNIDYSSDKEKCVIQYAISEKDYKLCESLNYNQSAKDNCIYSVAFNSNDEKICNNINDNKNINNCYYNVGVRKKDVESCKLILNNDFELLRDKCIMFVAILNNNDNLCLNINNEEKINECKMYVNNATSREIFYEKYIFEN